MNPQRRRLDSDTSSNATLDGTSDQCQILLDDAPAVNIHGLRYCFSIEPEVADANANGFWLLICLPAGVISVSADMPKTFSDLDNEDFLPYVWAVGCWTASNQAPFHHEVNPKTSRTCQKGARIIAYVVKAGISAGSVRINQTLTGFTTS